MNKYEYRREIFFFIILASLALAGPVAAQSQVFAYPKDGQTPEQQIKDQGECGQWAVQPSGFDLTRATTQPQGGYSAPSSPSGSGIVGGGAKGAALGAVGGAIGGDAGKGAEIGAATGALFGGLNAVDAGMKSNSRNSNNNRNWPSSRLRERRLISALLSPV